MSLAEIGRLMFRELGRIAEQQGQASEKIAQIQDLIYRLVAEVCREDKQQLASPELRLAYAAERYELSRAQRWRLNLLRRRGLQVLRGQTLTDKDYRNSLKTACYALAAFCKLSIPETLAQQLPETDEEDQTYQTKLKQVGETIAFMRVLVLEMDEANKLLKVRQEADEFMEVLSVRYDEQGYNEAYTNSLKLLRRDFKGKAVLHLFDVIVNQAGEYLPKIFVLEPDQLFDVTAISRVLNSDGYSPFTYLLQKLYPTSSTAAMTLGNVANQLFDRLLHYKAEHEAWEDLSLKGKTETPEPAVPDVREALREVFRQDPWSTLRFNDQEVKEMLGKAGEHFRNIYRVLRDDFAAQGISARYSVVEPSFYSQRYGLQGRLDLFQAPEPEFGLRPQIIELKSGKPFKANAYGLNEEHYLQTIMYDLLVRSVYELEDEPMKHILYSVLGDNALRFAPSKPEYRDMAMTIRNYAVAMERHLMNLDEEQDEALQEDLLLFRMPAREAAKLGNFNQRDLEEFRLIWQQTKGLERRYYRAFLSFLARESHRARLGVMDRQERNGAAGLWLNSLDEKKAQYEILDKLKIQRIEQDRTRMHVVLTRDEEDRNANFRQGETVVLYPVDSEEDTVLQHQIFKGFISRIDSQEVEVALNSRQATQAGFQRPLWRVEKDLSDKGSGALYQGLFRFLAAPSAKRDLLLGLCPPRQGQLVAQTYANAELGELQRKVLDKALATQDYFLLLGPPGTGKTKFMLAEMVRQLLAQPQTPGKPESILLLGFTNRSVDEMCEAIADFAGDKFLRLGNRYSCDARYLEQLIDTKLEKVNSRNEMLKLLNDHPIVLSTVASFASKADLFRQVKPFSTAIIDEASQLLEPHLVGLLPYFGRFIMIGDHKQLPAVVMQDRSESVVQDPLLQRIGLNDRRNSLFERLYRRAQAEGWDWAYDSLRQQGRMHQDIAEYPSRVFYQGNLELLPPGPGDWQRAPLNYREPAQASALQALICRKRFFFIPCAADLERNPKTNRNEAEEIARLVEAFQGIYAANGQTLKPENLGVITPFRAQIALIRNAIETLCPDMADCTIDTVERYQGGARDIILISTAVNKGYQLSGITSPSEAEGDEPAIDRKLNVALTRARHHLIIVGNREVLMQDPHYAPLIEYLEAQA